MDFKNVGFLCSIAAKINVQWLVACELKGNMD